MRRRDIHSRFLDPQDPFFQAALFGRGSIMPGVAPAGSGLLEVLDVNSASGAATYPSAGFPSYGRPFRQTTGALANDFMSFRSDNFNFPGAPLTRPELVWVFGNPSTTVLRFFAGMSAGITDDGMVAVDAPAFPYIGVRLNTELGDASYHMVSHDDFAGGPQLDLDTGIAPLSIVIALLQIESTSYTLALFDPTGRLLFEATRAIAPTVDLIYGAYQAIETTEAVAKIQDFFGATYRNRGDLVD